MTVATGRRVPLNTQAPLTLPGMLSTAGHWDQSSNAIVGLLPPDYGKPGWPSRGFTLRPGAPPDVSASLEYALPAAGRVRVRVYAATGALVRSLLDAVETAGAHRVSWDGRDNTGASAASGVYLLRVDAGNVSRSRKITLLK